MKRKRTPLEIWTLFSFMLLGLYALFLCYPLFNLLGASFTGREGGLGLDYFVKFFSEKYYISTLLNSLKVSLATTAFSLLLGVPLAYFFTAYRMRGARLMQVVIILCMMSAPFIGAYSWILLLGRSGVITKFVKAAFHITLPGIYGFGGIVLVLSTRLFPLVFLYVSGALRSIDQSLLEASQNLGCSGAKRFFKVTMPLCMPSILAAALMVFMRAMADFGTPLLIGEGYRTFPVEIYNQYVGETGTNHGFAAAISVVAIVITALVFLVQKYVANRFSFSISALRPMAQKKPKRAMGFFMHAYAYALLTVSMLPQVYVVYTSFRATNKTGNAFKEGYSLQSYETALKRMGGTVSNTLIIATVSLAVIVLLAVLIAYLAVRRKNAVNNIVDTLSMVPNILPGAVVGIALVIAFGQKPFLLTGTMAIMVIAMCVRRLPYTVRGSVAILQQIPMNIEEASISLGASKMKTFFTVTVPMMANGIVAGAILSWVTILTELSCSIILYNSRTITLTVGVYAMVSRGTDGPAAAIATILTLFTIVSLAVFTKVSKGREVIP